MSKTMKQRKRGLLKAVLPKAGPKPVLRACKTCGDKFHAQDKETLCENCYVDQRAGENFFAPLIDCPTGSVMITL